MTVEFTPREVAELSGTPKWTVEKAIEQRVLEPAHGRRGRRKRRRLLPLFAVAYVKVIDSVGLHMDVPMKRRLAAKLALLGVAEFRHTRLELATAVQLDVGQLVGDAVQRAEAYGVIRDAMIVEDEAESGGDPMIRDLGVSVYALAERASDGAAAAGLRADYPSLSAPMIETALIYVRANPPVGAPPRDVRRTTSIAAIKPNMAGQGRDQPEAEPPKP